jgi:phenylacetate-CoA ligase
MMHAPLEGASAIAKAVGIRAWRTPAELAAYQEARLRRLIEHAHANVPYYRALLDDHGVAPAQIRTLADLDRVPISSKADLRRRPAVELLAAGLQPDRLRRIQTTGSSGVPFVLYRSPGERRLHHLFWLRAYRDFGQRLGDRVVWVSARRQPAASRLARVGDLLRAIGLEGFGLDVTARPEDLLQELARLRPGVVVGYPGMLARLGEELQRNGRADIRPRVVIAGGEVLTGARRAQIEATWGVPVREVYSCWEVGLMAWQCRAAGTLHVCDDSVVLEVLKDGRPAKVGERGEVVLTSLHSFAMPFIRYRLGDVVARGAVACACGSPFSTIGLVQGRMLDFFRLPSGRLVHPYEIIAQLQEDGWVGQYQVVQEAADRIVVLIVPGPAFSSEKAAAFQARAAAVVGPEAKLRAEVVERIEAAPSGKFHLARSLVPATEGEPAWHHSAPVG